MKLILDIEANDLYQEASQIWCAVFKCVDTGKVWKFRKQEKIEAMLDRATVIIAHNGIGYDIPVLKKVWGYEYKGKVLDTVLLSRELYKNIPVPEQMKLDYGGLPLRKLVKKGDKLVISIVEVDDKTSRVVYQDGSTEVVNTLSKKLDGPHSLAAWGYRLGRGKVEHEDWSQYSPEMMHRCAEDVELTHLLYLKIKEKLQTAGFPPRAVWLTMDFMECISRQEKHGWKLDIPRAEKYVVQLSKWIGRIDNVLQSYLPILPTIREDVIKDDDTSEGFQNPFTKAGKLNGRLEKWVEKNDLGAFSEFVGGPFCRVAFRRVSLASDKEVKEFLIDSGWQPEEYNYSKTQFDEDGKPLRTSPKLSPDDAFIGVDGKMGRMICKRVQCVHRRSNIQGWLDRVRPDGRLEGRVSGFTDTYRVRHANIANVVGVDKFFGKQMRSCFIAEDGMVLVGVDMSACQDRMIISRARNAGIVDAQYEHMVLHGKKEDRTKSHCRAQDEVNKIFREEGIAEINYGTAKNFGFAYKFGCFPKKLGVMSGERNEKKAIAIGTIVMAAFDLVFQAQVKLQERMLKEWKETAKIRTVKYKWNGREQTKTEFYNGKIKGLDGRDVLIRNEKDVLVYGVQSDEALTHQLCVVLQNRRLQAKYEEGTQWRQVIAYHDETTIECVPEIAEDVQQIMEKAINDAGKYFNLAIEQIGEGAIGNSWRDIH